MNNEKKGYRRAVFIVVYRYEGENALYLVLKRKLHWKGWEFCKGGIEGKESVKSVVSREVKEETGQLALKIKNHRKVGKYKYPKVLKDRPSFIGQSYSLWSAEIKDKKVKFDKKEHSGFKWLDFNNALKLLTHKNQRKCLTRVNKSLKRLDK